MNKIYSLIILVALSLTACQKDQDPGGTEVQALAGEWWVQAKDADGNVLFNGAYSHISTYNTAANTATEMWFDDGFWGTKFKVPVNVGARTFGGASIPNSDPEYDITISIRNGKIIEKASKGPVSKAVTDSIYYEAEYSDDPGTTYYLSGYRRTRFAEDDH